MYAEVLLKRINHRLQRYIFVETLGTNFSHVCLQILAHKIFVPQRGTASNGKCKQKILFAAYLTAATKPRPLHNFSLAFENRVDFATR